MKKIIFLVVLLSLLPFTGVVVSSITEQEALVIDSKVEQLQRSFEKLDFDNLLREFDKERPATAITNANFIKAIQEDFNTKVLPDIQKLLVASIKNLKETDSSLQITDEKILDKLLETSPYFVHVRDYWLLYLERLARLAQEWEDKAIAEENSQDEAFFTSLLRETLV